MPFPLPLDDVVVPDDRAALLECALSAKLVSKIAQAIAAQRSVSDLIKTAADGFRRDIAESENELRKAVDPDSREELHRELANTCNQFAWLVGNTEGDFQEAVRISRRSVELSPQAGGLWDTLGRCYFAAGDLPNAIKAQQRAMKFEPHSGQMQRQLELFQKTLAEKQKGPAPQP